MRMTLLYQTHSPFARKVLVFAHERGLADQIQVEHHETSPTNPNVEVYNRNPLGKVPVLIRPDQPPLFDSDVICAYLDDLHDGQKLVPALGELRWRALRLQPVAQGLADTGIRLRWETVRRPKAFRYQPLADGYRRKLMTGLINTARMVGATLGVAVLGAVFAMHVTQDAGTQGLAPAYLGGGIGELIGAAAAFAFIRHDSLRPPTG
jgi:Glutathione S-transferase, N-terminal domain